MNRLWLDDSNIRFSGSFSRRVSRKGINNRRRAITLPSAVSNCKSTAVSRWKVRLATLYFTRIDFHLLRDVARIFLFLRVQSGLRKESIVSSCNRVANKHESDDSWQSLRNLWFADVTGSRPFCYARCRGSVWARLKFWNFCIDVCFEISL